MLPRQGLPGYGLEAGRGPAGAETSVPCSRPRPSPRTRYNRAVAVVDVREGRAMRVLLVEDHKPLVRALRQGLEEEGFAVDVAYDGEEGDFKARSSTYDVIILDRMLPKTDGLSLLQRWRKDGVTTHVLILSARDTGADKVAGLN